MRTARQIPARRIQDRTRLDRRRFPCLRAVRGRRVVLDRPVLVDVTPGVSGGEAGDGSLVTAVWLWALANAQRKELIGRAVERPIQPTAQRLSEAGRNRPRRHTAISQ